MTPITARQIFLEYVTRLNGNGPMPNYVTIEDYNRMATQADRNSDKVQELKAVVGELNTILQRWAMIGPLLSQMTTMYQFDTIPGFEQLIADTQAAIGGTNEPVNQ